MYFSNAHRKIAAYHAIELGGKRERWTSLAARVRVAGLECIGSARFRNASKYTIMDKSKVF